VVEGAALEKRCAGNGTEGSNPSLSAMRLPSVTIGLMPIAKRIGLSILSPLFVLLLFATAFDIGFVQTATHPATVKRLVAESGIYNSVVSNALAQTKSISTSYGSIPTSDPAIQSAARVSLSPRYIQQSTEAAIDDIYDWLNGQTAQPNFNIDLSGAKILFANNIADSTQKRLSALPACTTAQSLAFAQSGSFDAYSAACLPKGVSPAAIAEQVKTGIVNQQDFLATTDLTAANVKTGGSGQSVFSGQLAGAPKQYQRAKKTPAILIILTVLIGVGVVFLSRTWPIGLRHAGISLLIVGLIMLVFSWGLNRAMSTKVIPKIKVDNAIFQQDIRTLVTDITQQVDKNYWLFGGLYAGLGLVGITSAQLAIRKQSSGSLGNKAVGGQPLPRRPAEQSSLPPKSKSD
jgi:hypothetical protein